MSRNERFGAELMSEPELVKECVRGMQEVSDVHVTVKYHIVVYNEAPYDNLCRFIDVVSGGGVRTFIIPLTKNNIVRPIAR